MTINHTLKGTDPLLTGRWKKVNQNLLAKSIAELMHEQVAKPQMISADATGLTQFRLQTDQEHIQYTFSASPRVLDYWHVYPESIKKHVSGLTAEATDAGDFFVEMQETFGMKSFTLAHYLEELTHTLYADAYIHSYNRLTADELADAHYQTVEHQMDGHPWVIVNKSRLGFNHEDYTKYAPETGQTMRLNWIAVHQSRATFYALTEIEQQAFYEAELGNETLLAFRKVLTDLRLDPAHYHFMPVHDWQWNNKIVVQFAADIAGHLLIPVGLAEDEYAGQQSIRTLYNLSYPKKHYVKTAVSILSTGNIRGLSPKQMSIAPRVTQWVKDMLDGDAYLQDLGLVLLGEVATITYLHPHYQAIKGAPYQYREMLGVLWRESAEKYLLPGEKMMTMAALLYVDDEGKSLVGSLIEKSGLTAEKWLNAYLTVYLKPLLQLYYNHSLCVTPHGENIILIMKDYVPSRMIIKDFVDDIVLTRDAREKLPADLADGMIQSSNKDDVPLFILLGVFDAFFRYLSDVFHTHLGYHEDDFWQQVNDIVMDYQREHPELQQKFERFDLFVSEFARFYINSLRLFKGYEEGTDFAIPKKGGVLANPIATKKEQEISN
ncbi:IucA/IucC family protein [Pedobacter cryoconitis]|uniref:Siderophore synthetase component n=1 Tax=Pedobacter cryoconitis TaxID=188932 RepID=A0A7X0J8L6_9SPHI|nr:IucA/IucC family siderophore biosynthesis protein [Pedobacter cryoconitis]MBB6501701.1 siderophore synthetase component [Pedobacter cryoconitis]